MELVILIGGLAVLLLIGVPIAFALGVTSLVSVIYIGLPPLVIFQRMAAGMNIFALLAIPFFIYAGELMLHGGIAERLMRFANAIIGNVRGGLGLVNILTSMLFGGISGSAIADTSAIGSLMIPLMRKKGYDADYAVNVTVMSSTIGLVIPPSHNMIIYSLATGGSISVAALFMAGIVPGVLVGICLMVVAYVIALKRNYPREAFPGWKALVVIGFGAIPGLFTTVIIIGGVLSGIFTTTESAAVAVLYALLVMLLVYRTLTWKNFVIASVNAVRTTSMVMLLIGTAAAFGYLIALFQVPARVIDLMSGLSNDPIVVFMIINLVLLLLGTFMDMAPLILITTPIFLPVVTAFGMDPVQFGIVLMINLGLGLVTPPVGSVLFVGCAIAKIRIEETLRSVWPFYLAMLVALVLVTYIPAVSLTIPNLVLK